MSKYITAEQVNDAVALCKDEPFSKASVFAITELLPSADVVEVEPILKRIKADLNEAKESFSDCENETDKSFQQGRIFAHNYDLFVIERILKKTDKWNEYARMEIDNENT